MDSLENYYEIIRERWKFGIDSFSQDLKEYQNHCNVGKGYEFLKNRYKNKPISIRSSIYGDMYLEPEEAFILDSFYLQRLKGISQLGFAHHVYPDSRHSRFEHSLGVLYITKKITDRLLPSDTLHPSSGQEIAKKELRFAALLHDIGHGPMSHFSESFMHTIGLEKIYRQMVKDYKIKSKLHEKKARDMILENDRSMEVINPKSTSLKYGLSEYLKSLGCNPTRIAGLITAENKGLTEADTGIVTTDKFEDSFTPVINGAIDADKLDYLIRDAYFTGVTAGKIDADRLISLLTLHKGKLVFSEKSVDPIVNMIFSRELMSSTIANHHVTRITCNMLLAAMHIAIGLLDTKEKARFVEHLDLMNDNDLITCLEIIAKESKKHEESDILKNLLNRLNTRRLYKRGRILSYSEMSKLIPNQESDPEKNLSHFIEDLKEIRPAAYIIPKKLSEKIKEKNDDSLINPCKELTDFLNSFQKNEVLILDVSQILKDTARFDSELCDIQLIKNNEIVQIKDCLPNLKLSETLSHLQIDVWKTYLLVPEGNGAKNLSDDALKVLIDNIGEEAKSFRLQFIQLTKTFYTGLNNN